MYRVSVMGTAGATGADFESLTTAMQAANLCCAACNSAIRPFTYISFTKQTHTQVWSNSDSTTHVTLFRR